jgi:hypothetical protein
MPHRSLVYKGLKKVSHTVTPERHVAIIMHMHITIMAMPLSAAADV